MLLCCPQPLCKDGYYDQKDIFYPPVHFVCSIYVSSLGLNV